MNPVRYTVTGTASGTVVNLDYRQNPFNVGIGATVNGVATYSIQHTFDDVYSGSFNAATANWQQNSNLNGTTATGSTNYAFPVVAVRGNVTAATGTANVVFTFIQASNAP